MHLSPAAWAGSAAGSWGLRGRGASWCLELGAKKKKISLTCSRMLRMFELRRVLKKLPLEYSFAFPYGTQMPVCFFPQDKSAPWNCCGNLLASASCLTAIKKEIRILLASCSAEPTCLFLGGWVNWILEGCFVSLKSSLAKYH